MQATTSKPSTTNPPPTGGSNKSKTNHKTGKPAALPRKRRGLSFSRIIKHTMAQLNIMTATTAAAVFFLVASTATLNGVSAQNQVETAASIGGPAGLTTNFGGTSGIDTDLGTLVLGSIAADANNQNQPQTTTTTTTTSNLNQGIINDPNNQLTIGQVNQAASRLGATPLVIDNIDNNIATAAVNNANNYFTVRSEFNPVLGGLIYEILDVNNYVVQRVEKFFPVPPTPECYLKSRTDLYTDLRNARINIPAIQNTSIIANVQCCDYYIPSLGYQYTQCGQGVGIFILPSKVGTSRSAAYFNQQLLMNNVSWNGLVALLNQYAVNSGFQGNYTSFLSINVPWQEYYNAYIANPMMTDWTKNNLKEWINRYEDYINAGGPEVIINENAIIYNSPLVKSNSRLRRMLQVGPNNAPSVNNIINPPDGRPVPLPEQRQNDNLPPNQQNWDQRNQEQQQQQQQQQQGEEGAYWLSDYDNQLILATTVIQNLTARGIYPLFASWYQVYFHPNGIVTQYYEAQNLQNGNITPNQQSAYWVGQTPAYMVPIINWISTLVGNQVKANCGECVTQFPR